MKHLGLVSLKALRSVEAVGRLGTLRAAADELSVTEGAVSQQVHKAEAQLECRLFERLPTGMRPTDLGAAVIARLSSGMAELAAAVSLATRREDDVLTVSVAPVFAGRWLVWRLNRFHEAHPGVRLRIDAVSALVDPDRSDVDVCIRSGDGRWPGVEAVKLADQSVFPVCSPRLASTLTGPRDLAGVPIIRDTGEPDRWGVWLRSHDLELDLPTAGPAFSDAALCLDAAIAGQGVLMAWETLAGDALAGGHLVEPFSHRVDTGLAYWSVTGRLRPRTKAVRALEAWLMREMTEARRTPGR